MNTPLHTPRQPISTALREWIATQIAAGFTPDVVLQSMRASGWSDDVARDALDSSLRRHSNALDLPPAVPVPNPALEGAPLFIDAGDRRVAVLQTMTVPRIVVFGSLLGDDECDTLIALARPRMARSLTVATDTGGDQVNDDRTSRGMFFERGEHALVARIEARIAHLLRWPVENGEGLQILNYHPGAEYKPHYDYFDPAAAGTPSILTRGGQRVATLVMYLGAPEKGGGTNFPDVHLEVAPQRGNAVFFSYERPHPSTQTLHGGAPVVEGEKWIATKWLREREFH